MEKIVNRKVLLILLNETNIHLFVNLYKYVDNFNICITHNNLKLIVKNIIHIYDLIIFNTPVGVLFRVFQNLKIEKYSNISIITIDPSLKYTIPIIGTDSIDYSYLLSKIVDNRIIITNKYYRSAYDLIFDNKLTINFNRYINEEYELYNSFNLTKIKINSLNEKNIYSKRDTILPFNFYDLHKNRLQTTKNIEQPYDLIISNRYYDNLNYRNTLIVNVKNLIIGIGLSTTININELLNFILYKLKEYSFNLLNVKEIRTINLKLKHKELNSISNILDADIKGYSLSQLNQYTNDIKFKSENTLTALNTYSVSEASTIIPHKNKELYLYKSINKDKNITISINSIIVGHLFLVGIGNNINNISNDAISAIKIARYIIGYSKYIDIIEKIIDRLSIVYRFNIGEEIERAKLSLSLANKGNYVVLISSGDINIYGMSNVVLKEYLDNKIEYSNLKVTIIPGITTATIANSKIGNIFTRDYLTLSLSDIHYDSNKILRRVKLCISEEIAIAIYNPRGEFRIKCLYDLFNLLIISKVNKLFLIRNSEIYDEDIIFLSLNANNKNDIIELINMNTIILIPSQNLKRINYRYFFG